VTLGRLRRTAALGADHRAVARPLADPGCRAAPAVAGRTAVSPRFSATAVTSASAADAPETAATAGSRAERRRGGDWPAPASSELAGESTWVGGWIPRRKASSQSSPPAGGDSSRPSGHTL
jgi:hypothetical protein